MNGKELKEMRISAELTQAQLANILNVTVTTVSQWERGATNIHPLMADGIMAKIKHLVANKEDISSYGNN